MQALLVDADPSVRDDVRSAMTAIEARDALLADGFELVERTTPGVVWPGVLAG